MNRPEHQVRRATVNDLAQLRTIWDLERYPTADLEKRFTEFQVVETLEGKLIGAIGLQIQGLQGRIHSETIGEAEHTEWLRPLLWERLQGVARNHGLVRLWVDLPGKHWPAWGFQEAPVELLEKLPEGFGPGKWHYLQLKEDMAANVSIEHELLLFRESQKQTAEKLQEQARIAKAAALIIAVLFSALLLFAAFRIYTKIRGPQGTPLIPQQSQDSSPIPESAPKKK